MTQLKIKQALVLVILSFFGTGLYGKLLTEKSDKVTTHASWNFELYNKSDKTIYFSLRDHSSNASLISQEPLLSGKKIRAIVDTDHELEIKVWSKGNPKDKSFFARTPTPDIARALIANGKTIFLSFDETKEVPLYPQTGQFWGFLGKTDSGLDNENNIGIFGLKEIEYAE